MPAGLINIIAGGTNDLYLNGAPEITFFKTVHRRYTNFAKESIEVALSGMDFGKTIEIEIPKVADLMSTTYLQIDLPEINILKTDLISNITQQEEIILTTPYPIALPSYVNSDGDTIEINFTTDYSLIKTYMSVNIQGYRSAIRSSKIKNQTVTQYINSIIDSIQALAIFYPGIITSYEATINNAFNYEVSNNNFTLASFLNFKFSDMTYILNQILASINDNSLIVYGFSNPQSITVSDVLSLLTSAKTNCQQIINYYFDKVKAINIQKADNNSLYSKFAWNAKLGHTIIDYIEIKIGGDSIDKHYGDWINIWYELTRSGTQNELYDKMIGNTQEMITFDRNAKPQYSLFIPLTFWFSKYNGLAFPLIALQFNKLYVTVKLKNLEDCAYVEKLPITDQAGNSIDFSDNTLGLTDVWNNLGLVMTAKLLVDYIYLDTLERRRFAQSSHEYLIETVELTEIPNVNDVKQIIEMSFNGPSKEIFFVCQKNAYVNNFNTETNKSNLKSLWFNYSTDANTLIGINPVSNIRLTYNGYDRLFAKDGAITNYLNSYNHHSSTPSDGVNIINFSLFPEEHQPSGSCNFTRIKHPILNFIVNNTMFTYNLSDIDPSITKGSSDDKILETDIDIRIYSMRMNILRVSHGRSAIAYH